jgi:membrane protease YdiL (CAAX protease family)
MALAEQPSYPTIAESWASIGWYLLISLLCGLAAIVVLDVFLHQTGGSRLAGLFIAGETGLLLTILWLRRRAGPVRWPTLVWREQPEMTRLYLLLPVIVLAQAMLLTALSFLRLPNWSSALFQNISHYPLLAFGMGCVVAPVLEEVLFRGVLLKGLLRNYRPSTAILQSAVLFGVFHFNPAQSATATLIGLLLGWLYYRTRSVPLCIALHGMNNLLAFSAMKAPAHLQDERNMLNHLGGVWGYLLVWLVAAGILFSIIQWVNRSVMLLRAPV